MEFQKILRYGDILKVILVSRSLLIKTEVSYIAAVLIPIELCPRTRYIGLWIETYCVLLGS